MKDLRVYYFDSVMPVVDNVLLLFFALAFNNEGVGIFDDKFTHFGLR